MTLKSLLSLVACSSWLASEWRSPDDFSLSRSISFLISAISCSYLDCNKNWYKVTQCGTNFVTSNSVVSYCIICAISYDNHSMSKSYQSIPYHAILYLPYHTIPYRTIPYHTTPHHTTPYEIIPYQIHHTTPYNTMPWHGMPYHAIPNHTLCHILYM